MKELERPKGFEHRAEQIEAAQKEVNQVRGEFYESCSDEDKAKLDAVDKAVGLLTEAGVPFYGYIKAPCYATEDERTLQFNNWGDVLNPDKDIGWDEKRSKTVHNLWHQLVVGIFTDFGHKHLAQKSPKEITAQSPEENWLRTLSFFKTILEAGPISEKSD